MDLKVVSWNIRKAVGLDWRRDPDRVLRVLQAVDADIVILQEADKRMQPRPPALPLDAVERAGWVALNADPATPSIGHHGNALLLRPDLRMERIEGLDLPGLEPRGAVLARIEGRGRAVTIGGLHLGLRRGDRIRQLTTIMSAVEGFGGPVIMAGDLNEWSDNGGHLPVPDGWTVVAPGPSFHASGPMVRFDRFILGPGVAVAESGVVPKADAMRASDHLPIWIRLSV